MNAVNVSFLEQLNKRKLVVQTTGFTALEQHLQTTKTLYCGFDPTADSLHVGHLLPLLVLRRFQLAGHQPIALLGGATGLIGDPSFKAKERALQSKDSIAIWGDKIKKQLNQFLDTDSGSCKAIIENNLNWYGCFNVLDFLRDIGKHFSINAMLNKESVKLRLARDESGISFTEFSYALLQSFDFAYLYKHYNCTLQIGGSDQWGNIVDGIDLVRRQHQAQVFGLTIPLITRADGVKFGKTENGAVWLDPVKTSPYKFYQFWMNASDQDVYQFMRYFTFMTLEEINQIECLDQESVGRKKAQTILADELTALVHGKEALKAAKRITEAVFLGEFRTLAENELDQLKLDGLPFKLLSYAELCDYTLTKLLIELGIAVSGKQIKDTLSRQGVLVNSHTCSIDDNLQLSTIFTKDQALYGKYFLVRFGKKKHALIELIA